MHPTSHVPLALRIAVLNGGSSSEREISLKSGQGVINALNRRGHTCTSIDPADVDLERIDWGGFDAAFNALHGEFGEDGQVQDELAKFDVPMPGCSANAARATFSKTIAKECFRKHDVRTPAWYRIHETDSATDISNSARRLGYPLVVKPESQGSSLGVTIVDRPEELPAALTQCFHFDEFGLLEDVIDGPEITVGFVDGTSLPPIRVSTPRTFYDYRAKYNDDETSYSFDLDLPQETVADVVDAAQRACRATQVSGLVRVDIRVDSRQQPWVLEINTVPGLTDRSLIPKAARHAGIDPGQLYESLILSTCRATPVQRVAG